MKRDSSIQARINDKNAAAVHALSSRKRAMLQKKLTKKDMVNGHHLIAKSLKRLGVTHIYGLSGTPIGETLSECAKVGIRSIGVRHQQAGVMMATAQNYIAGCLTAVTAVSAGPGITNTVTGILVAKDNCWPLVVLGGRRSLRMQGMGSFQDLDAIPIFQSITKWSVLIEKTESLGEVLDRAFFIATSGRPGPVYLDIPEEVLTGTASGSNSTFAERYRSPSIDGNAIERAAQILLEAQRPGIILGKGVRWSEPYEELRQLVDIFGIPFITSPMGQGYLPDDHPLCHNVSRGLFQSKADVILSVGVRLNWTFRFGTELARDVKLIQIDIDDQEIGVNVTPTVGITGDVKEVLRRIILCMNAKVSGHPKAGRLAPWTSMLSEKRKNKLDVLRSKMVDNALPMSPHRMMREIRDFLPRDAICVLDGNISMAAAQEVLPSYLPASRLTAGSNGCMGVGIPFGIGAKLRHPDRMVVIICGDAALGFNVMEMETAVRHRIPIIVVVVNNDGISGATVQKKLYPPDHERVTMFQPGIRYDQIMARLGGHPEFVGSPNELAPALERAAASGSAACINVRVDPNATYPVETDYCDREAMH